MERRKILLGSGAAFATALAGCTGLTSNDDGGDDNGPNGSGGPNGDDGYTDDDKDKKDDKDDETDHKDDEKEDYETIPGFEDHMDLGGHGVTIKYAKWNGEDVKIGVKLEKNLDEFSEDDVEKLAKAAGKAIKNYDNDKFEKKFQKKVETVTFSVYDKKNKLLVELFVNVKHLLKYYDGEIDLDELKEKMNEEYK